LNKPDIDLCEGKTRCPGETLRPHPEGQRIQASDRKHQVTRGRKILLLKNRPSLGEFTVAA